jgi:hypothetical protein
MIEGLKRQFQEIFFFYGYTSEEHRYEIRR